MSFLSTTIYFRDMCFGIVNYAKLCIFYWVLICFKVVIKDQIEDTEFLKKSSRKTHFQHFFSMYLNRSLNSNSIKTETYCLLDNSLIDWNFVLDRSLDNSISIDRVSRISKNLSHLLEGFLEREIFCLCG